MSSIIFTHLPTGTGPNNNGVKDTRSTHYLYKDLDRTRQKWKFNIQGGFSSSSMDSKHILFIYLFGLVVVSGLKNKDKTVLDKTSNKDVQLKKTPSIGKRSGKLSSTLRKIRNAVAAEKSFNHQENFHKTQVRYIRTQ